MVSVPLAPLYLPTFLTPHLPSFSLEEKQMQANKKGKDKRKLTKPGANETARKPQG